MNELRIASFIENTMRPLTEDAKRILEELRGLNMGLTPDHVRKMVLALGVWHLVGEILRAGTYIGITWIVCQTIVQLL